MPRPRNEQIREQIRALILAGKNVREISETLRVSTQRVYQLLDDIGLKPGSSPIAEEASA